MYGLVTITPPAVEPVSLTLAKTHLRIDHDAEDLLIAGWIPGARALTESYTGRRWIEQRLRLTLGEWPCDGENRLPVEPVASVDLVKYFDVDGVERTIDPELYQTWLDHSPPLLLPAPNQYWPQLQYGKRQAVTIEFTAGGDPADVPEQVKTAILMILGNWSENRADQNVLIARGMPPNAKWILDSLWTGSYA